MRAALERRLADLDRADQPSAPPSIPDHTLLRRIGSGAYGEVWLARNALGTLRAVKVVFRAHFKEDRPYERELHGILKYEPISRTHEGLVQVLHVGRNDAAGCFYYVMELADAAQREVISEAVTSKSVESQRPVMTGSLTTDALITDYSPRTLRSELARFVRLAPADAAQLVLRLAHALAHLHAHGLVHRDIKPGNVIFVHGQPKLADIGLVTDVGSSHSFVGTEGFIPPEGPGTRQADLYGLGKLLYELATGRDRLDFPQLPPLGTQGGQPRAARRSGDKAVPDEDLRSPRERSRHDDGEALLELNEVMTRACAPDPKQRYASATELQADLNLFLAGRSLRSARLIERALARLRKFSYLACAFLLLAAGALWFVKNEEHHANERARQASERARVEAASRVKETALRLRAESAERATQQQLYQALIEQARATVRSGELGHRVRALDAIRRAAAISNSAELRREVLAALALPDLRFERELTFDREDTHLQLDPSFERLAVGHGKGPVEIRALPDNRLLTSLPASTNLPSFYREWSADGRFLAVKRDYPDGGQRADWEVWDVPAARRVLLLRDGAYSGFAFHPRLPRVIAHRRAEGVAMWNLEDGRELIRFPKAGRASILRFSPDGERFAAVSPQPPGMIVSVHDATRPDSSPLAVSPVITETINTFAWHPEGRWLAVPDHGTAVHWMDAQTGETGLIGRHKLSAVRAVFSPDGAYLFTGGWERELICWDARTRRRVFGISLNSDTIQISADGRRCAVLTPTNVQLHALERPTAHREFAEDLGGLLRQAAFSPDGRWLAASGDKHIGLWDLKGGGPGALTDKGSNTRLYFTPDARELFATRNSQGTPACFRWRITPATNATTPPILTRLPLRKPQGFTYLCLSSNSVVMTGTNGSQILAPSELEAGGEHWTPTHAGITGVSPDGRWLGIYRSFGASLYIYRLPEMERVAKLTQPTSFGDFDFSPRGDEVAIGSLRTSTRIELWSTTTWERTRTLTNFGRLLYPPDARTLWLTKDQRTAGLYDARTLEPLLPLPAGMLPLALSPDGDRLAVSVDAQRLQVWDLAAVRDQLRELGLDWLEGQ